MKKKLITFIISALLIISVCLNIKQYMQLQDAKAVIEMAEQDNPDYWMDVMVETDTWYFYSCWD
jgi:hypothetical protein